MLPFLRLLERPQNHAHSPTVIKLFPQIHALRRRLGVSHGHLDEFRRRSAIVPPHQLQLVLLKPILNLGAVVDRGFKIFYVGVVA
jgi:hypothetical protein